ncbi:MAG TPA: ferredoxin family protein [Candidatus Angelobacter sp.]|nr:ferredoxin family protein [Candidatus Angelobacter sp.]
MAYVIAEPCIGNKDTACLVACPVDAIHPSTEAAEFASATQLYIDPACCICCAACVPVCPVGAIYAEEDLPERWKHFLQINANYR